MTPLERAARALCELEGRDPDDISGGAHPSGIWLDEGEPWWTGYQQQVLAVAKAFREPTPEMLAAVDDDDPDKMIARGRAYSAYTAMIDTLIEEAGR